MRKRYENKRNGKRKELLEYLTSIEESISLAKNPSCILESFQAENPLFDIDWALIPHSLDPAAGELHEIRAKRFLFTQLQK